jgi:RNA polymerase sigma factor (TIGR02999 family)
VHFLSGRLFPMNKVTQILERIRAGEPQATGELLPIVYNELRRLAGRKLAAEPDHPTIQTTELVHEAYLRLVGSDQSWDCRGHFLAAAAEAMRRILVDRARRRRRVRHGGNRRRVELHESAVKAGDAPEELLVVNDLLEHLAEKHPIEAEIVKLHYFAGLNISEAAAVLGIPVSSAHRQWNFARAWLFRRLKNPSAE